MDLLNLAKTVMGSGSLMNALNALMTEQGGLTSLVSKFDTANLGQVAQSWISNGANLPISAEQLRKVLGEDQISQLSAKMGMTPEAAEQKLTAVLPEVINALTPNGKIEIANLNTENLMKAFKAIST